jgi:hypothetical protein
MIHSRLHPSSSPGVEEIEARRTTSVEAWLAVLGRLVRLPPRQRLAIQDELHAHLQERVRDLMLAGRDEAEAVQLALGELGETAELARRLEHAHRYPFRRRIMHLSWLALSTGVVATAVIALNDPSSDVPSSRYEAAPAPPRELETTRLSLTSDTTLAGLLEMLQNELDRGVYARWSELEEIGVTADLQLGLHVPPAPGTMVLDAVTETLSEHDEVEWRFGETMIELGLRYHFDRRERSLVTYQIGSILNDPEYGQTQAESVELLTSLITSLVTPDYWACNGGDLAQIHVVGPKLFVQAPRRAHEQVRWILAELSDGRATTTAAAEGS